MPKSRNVCHSPLGPWCWNERCYYKWINGLCCLFKIVMYRLNRRKRSTLFASSEGEASVIRQNTKQCPGNIEPFRTRSLTNYRLFEPLKSMPPTTPAAIATPLNIATPINPSLATFSSIRPLRLSACKFAGSWSKSLSLYRFASA